MLAGTGTACAGLYESEEKVPGLKPGRYRIKGKGKGNGKGCGCGD